MVSHSLAAGLRRSGARWASPADGTAMAQAKAASQTWRDQTWRIDAPPCDVGRPAGLLGGSAPTGSRDWRRQTMPQPTGIENVAMSHGFGRAGHCCTPPTDARLAPRWISLIS